MLRRLRAISSPSQCVRQFSVKAMVRGQPSVMSDTSAAIEAGTVREQVAGVDIGLPASTVRFSPAAMLDACCVWVKGSRAALLCTCLIALKIAEPRTQYIYEGSKSDSANNSFFEFFREKNLFPPVRI